MWMVIVTRMPGGHGMGVSVSIWCCEVLLCVGMERGWFEFTDVGLEGLEGYWLVGV